MPLQDLVRIAVEGSVLSTSGQARKVVNAFCYRKIQYNVAIGPVPFWQAFQPLVWNLVLGQLTGGGTGWTGVAAWVDFPLDGVAPPTNCGNPGNATSPLPRLPLNVCVYMNLRTAARGRQFVGSKRWGPISTFQCVGDEWTAGFIGAMNGIGNAMLQPLVIGVLPNQDIYVPVVWSRVRWPPNSFIVPDALSDITGFHVNKTLGQWKHRREKVVR